MAISRQGTARLPRKPSIVTSTGMSDCSEVASCGDRATPQLSPTSGRWDPNSRLWESTRKRLLGEVTCKP